MELRTYSCNVHKAEVLNRHFASVFADTGLNTVIEQNFGGKKFGEIVILKHWRKKLWRIQGLPAFSL